MTENHPCKRCGKPVAHPIQEYCSAHCSARRKQPYPQPDERKALLDELTALGQESGDYDQPDEEPLS